MRDEALRRSTPPLKARWYDSDDDVQADNILKATSVSALAVEPHLTVQSFFDRLAADGVPSERE